MPIVQSTKLVKCECGHPIPEGTPCPECDHDKFTPIRKSGLVPGYVPRVLNEADTLRLIVLCVKHVDITHHDWEEVCQLVQKFDESNVSKLLGT